MDLNGDRRNDVRLNHHMVQWDQHDGMKSEGGFNVLLCCLVLASPFLLHFIGRNTLKALEGSRRKTNASFFWALSSLSHIFNIYLMVKLFLATCYPYRDPNITIPACETAGVAAGVLFISSLILAILHRKHITLPLPKSVTICIECFTNREGLLLKIELLIKTLSLWGIYQCVTIHSLCAPFQVLMVMTNPHYYGFIILTVWCMMCECVVLTSIPFTLDQIYCTEKKYKLTRKHAFYQIMFTSYIAVLLFGLGSLTFSVVLLLHLSKHGQKTHSFTGSVYFILRYTLLPFFLAFMKAYLKKFKIALSSLKQLPAADN